MTDADGATVLRGRPSRCSAYGYLQMLDARNAMLWQSFDAAREAAAQRLVRDVG